MIFLMILNLEQLQQMVELNQHLNLVVKVNLMLIFFILNDFLFILIFYYLSFSYRYYHHPHLNYYYHHYHCRLANYLNLHYFINQIIHLINQVIFVDLNLYFNFNLCSSTITILFIIINKCYLSIFTNIYKDIQIYRYTFIYIYILLLYCYIYIIYYQQYLLLWIYQQNPKK